MSSGPRVGTGTGTRTGTCQAHQPHLNVRHKDPPATAQRSHCWTHVHREGKPHAEDTAAPHIHGGQDAETANSPRPETQVKKTCLPRARQRCVVTGATTEPPRVPTISRRTRTSHRHGVPWAPVTTPGGSMRRSPLQAHTPRAPSLGCAQGRPPSRGGGGRHP